MNNTSQLLKTLYEDYSAPYGLSSIDKLYKEAKRRQPHISKDAVKKYLQTSRAYTLHKLNPKKFKKLKAIAGKPRVILTCDIADFSHLQEHNEGYRYILVCIDVFSKYLQLQLLKRKNSQHVLRALKKIFNSNESYKYTRLWTDFDRGFYNKDVQTYLKSKNVKLYSVFSHEKASIAERVIRTLKNKIYRYLTNKNTLSYVRILPDIVKAYNNTIHTGLKNNKITPFVLHNSKNKHLWTKQFRLMFIDEKENTLKKNSSSALRVGDTVRIVSSRRDSPFNKAYLTQNTEEIFRISGISRVGAINIYTLRDLENESISGRFYRSELTPAALPDYYPVEIIKERRRGNKKEYFVHFIGYPVSSQRWISAHDMKSISDG